MAANVVDPIPHHALGLPSSIGDLVQNFDFSKMNIRDKKSGGYLQTNLAPSYGNLDGSVLQKLDDDMKAMIAEEMKSLAAEPDKSWAAAVSIMMNSSLIETDEAEVFGSDTLIKESIDAMVFNGSPNATFVQKVKSWFTKLVNDNDVLQSTKIDIELLANIVSQTGATVDSFESIFGKNEYHELTLVGIGVLRFPDLDRPYFMLYCIKLVAWSDSSRVIFVQSDNNGITGEYNSRIFRPRKSVIDSLTAEARAKAIAAANALFG